jgi:hypothetical protein
VVLEEMLDVGIKSQKLKVKSQKSKIDSAEGMAFFDAEFIMTVEFKGKLFCILTLEF